MSTPDARAYGYCPTCGVEGDDGCSSSTGRDHPSRRHFMLGWLAARAALDAPATEPDLERGGELPTGTPEPLERAEPDTTDPADGLSHEVPGCICDRPTEGWDGVNVECSRHGDGTPVGTGAIILALEQAWHRDECGCGAWSRQNPPPTRGCINGLVPPLSWSVAEVLAAARQRPTQQTSAERVVEAVESEAERRLAAVEVAINAIDDKHAATANPRYCNDGACAMCDVVETINAALQEPHARQRPTQQTSAERVVEALDLAAEHEHWAASQNSDHPGDYVCACGLPWAEGEGCMFVQGIRAALAAREADTRGGMDGGSS